MTEVDSRAQPSVRRAELSDLRTVLDAVQAYIFTKDLEGRYTYANRQVCELFGRPLEQVLGQRDEAFFGGAGLTDVQSADQKVLATGHPYEQMETLEPAGAGRDQRVYWVVKVPLRDAQGRIVGLCGISTDITARRNTERRLEKYRQMLDTVLSAVNAHVYMKDDQRRYLYVNPQVAQVFQRTVEDIIGRTDAELQPADVADGFKALDDQVFADGQARSGEEVLIGPQGERLYFWSRKMLLRRPGEADCLIGFSTDITELKQAQQAVAQSEARFRALFVASSDAVAVLGQDHLLDVNPAALRMLGVASREAFCALPLSALSPPCQSCGTASEVLMAEHLREVAHSGSSRFDWTFRRIDTGAVFSAEVVLSALDWDGDRVVLVTARDLTERKRYEARIHELAFYDVLTGLPNRRLLYDRLHQAMWHIQRSRQHGALIFLDLDNFKPLNDRHGHVAGDLLLQEVARRLSTHVRVGDTVARLGGDEFVVLLLGLDETPAQACRQALAVAEKIRIQVALPYELALGHAEAQRVRHACSASLGLSLLAPADDMRVDDALRRADHAMYQAKAAGRAQIRLDAEAEAALRL